MEEDAGAKIVQADQSLRIPGSGCRLEGWNPAIRASSMVNSRMVGFGGALGRTPLLRRSDEDRRLCKRHFWRSEGFHGETKTQHGLRRAVRRRLGNMKIQSCLTAAAINLKRLAAAFHARSPASGTIRMREMLVPAVLARWTGRICRMRTGFA